MTVLERESRNVGENTPPGPRALSPSRQPTMPTQTRIVPEPQLLDSIACTLPLAEIYDKVDWTGE